MCKEFCKLKALLRNSCKHKPVPSSKLFHTCKNVLTATQKPTPDILLKFLHPEVTEILQRLTGTQNDNVVQMPVAGRNKFVNYDLLSDEELMKEKERAESLTERRMQMPPYMSERVLPSKPLLKDPQIAPALDSKYVFIDISARSKRIPMKHARPVVVRHENGDLCVADPEIHDRVVRTYLLEPGQEVIPPTLFQDKHLKELLQPEKYLYLLDLACSQFEPDNPEFIRITHLIYDHAAANENFRVLEGTRFFGPLVFHLAVKDKLEPLLVYYIQEDRLMETRDTIHLGQLVRNEKLTMGSVFTVVQAYVKDQVENAYSVIQTQSVMTPATKTEEEQRLFEDKINNLELLQNTLKEYTRKHSSMTNAA
ncbi:28S ribosomal protein S22, mitochondrial-like [Mya arenaria]|uniref:28S ribosomal protein S22, mitochondrial-like n=1 Tax=Mya arenaria TaxID=6604 RepID=UPI0022E7CA1A|nr:28S ribosomal protein S22, mitochondrial-like [Mya arenaria]